MMSATTSATTGRRYGLERVCRTWRGRARRSTRGGRVRSAESGVLARRAAGRRPRCRMRSFWRPFAAT